MNHDIDPRLVASVPGQGWYVAWRNEDGSIERMPIVAWVTYDDGDTRMQWPDASGFVTEELPNNSVLWHPEWGPEPDVP